MKSIQSIISFLAKWTLATVAVLVVIGFGVQPSAHAQCPHVDCTGNIDFAHIRDRHCKPNTCPPKSILDAGHCATNDALRELCNRIKANGAENQQPNGRYKCVANLNQNVGSNLNDDCNQTTSGTVIYGTGKTFQGNYVITEFPGQ